MEGRYSEIFKAELEKRNPPEAVMIAVQTCANDLLRCFVNTQPTSENLFIIEAMKLVIKAVEDSVPIDIRDSMAKLMSGYDMTVVRLNARRKSKDE